jgi:hypothetical protein
MNKATKKKAPVKRTRAAKKPEVEPAEPLMVSNAVDNSRIYPDPNTPTRSRRNKTASIIRTDRFKNIEDGLIPFKYTTDSTNSSGITVRDAVILCQKAYYNFAIFRNTIDLMTEFTSGNVYFTGGSKKVNKFIEAFFDKINLVDFQNKFYREYFRSGNVFIYRFDSKISTDDFKRINQTFGSSLLAEDNDLVVPSKYITLNPSDIQLTGNVTFVNPTFHKVLTDYELERVKNPRTEEDFEVLESLDKETKEAIKRGKKLGAVRIPLSTDKVSAIFYKKQDYEPFAVPMGFPVLEDLNWKAEMKKMDMSIARTMQQSILLVTMGDVPEKGGINQRNLLAMQKLFQNESVGRVLIADYTTRAEFVVPKIADLLDPRKYQIVNEDIQVGLNNILTSGGEKYANMQIKVSVFVERLKQARQVFIQEFLKPEIKRICKSLGFKNFPMPNYEDIDLSDSSTADRVYTRLMELGILTPEEGIQAIQSGRLPTREESLEAQKEFRGLKDDGFYEPIVMRQNADSGNKPEVPQEGGRPEKISTPLSEQRDSAPIGLEGSVDKVRFSLSSVKDNMLTANKLEDHVQKLLKKKFSKRSLTKNQKEVAFDISKVVMANERKEDWISEAKIYIEKPVDRNHNIVEETQSIAYEHQLDDWLASILRESKAENE